MALRETELLTEMVQDFIWRRCKPQVSIYRPVAGTDFHFRVVINDMMYERTLSKETVQKILADEVIPYLFLEDLAKKAMVDIAKAILKEYPE